MINELSIIIPAYNEEKYLPKLLESIALQDFNGKLEIIIVDGDSEDNTIHVAKIFLKNFNDVSILALRKRGIGYQRNKGAEKAKYKYLLFLDSDMILPRHFLNRFLRRIDTRGQFIATSNTWFAEKDLLTYFFGIFMYPSFLFIFLREKVVPGFLLLTTKENHKKIHGFREDLKIAEDVDYGWRSLEKGASYQLKFYPIALHSARRLHKVGRIKLFYDYLRGYRAAKKYGIEAAGETIDYPFGIFG